MNGQYKISDRQMQLIELASNGATDKQIAQALDIKVGTLRTYWDRMRARLGAKSRTEVIARIYQAQLNTLCRQQEHLVSLMTGSLEFLWTSRPDGYVDFCNAWFMNYAGVASEACLGSGCKFLMPPSEMQQSEERWRNAQITREPYDARVHFRRGLDGEFLAHQIHLFPLLTEQGQLYKWVGTANELISRPSRKDYRAGL